MKDKLHSTNTEQSETLKRIARLKNKLASSASPIGDWKGIKQREYVDAGRTAPYSSVEMQEYYNARLAVRAEINELEAKLANFQNHDGEG